MPDPFPTTKWTLLRKIRDAGSANEQEVAEVLEYVCTVYWRPIRSHLMMLGKKEEEAKDLTQGFLAHLLEKKILSKADSDRGRLRTFIISALNQYVISEWRREQTVKRGGRSEFIPMEDNGIDLLGESPVSPGFDRLWARQVYERSLHALERDYRNRGKAELVEALIPRIGSLDEPAAAMEPLAKRLGITLPALRVHLHRARKRFGDCLRDELRALQTPEDELEEELRYVLSLLDD